jgi:hypothetical protein
LADDHIREHSDVTNAKVAYVVASELAVEGELSMNNTIAIYEAGSAKEDEIQKELEIIWDEIRESN